MGYIYLITNTVNNKRYVGQTLCEDIETRWKQHKIHKPRSVGGYIYNAYKKYGIDKFKFQIICICFDEDCNRFEEEYIKNMNTLAPNGYNLQTGGNNFRTHPDTKKKLSEINTGKKLSEITKKKLSELSKGEKNSQFGRKWTQEEIDAIWTPEFRENRSKKMSGVKSSNYQVKSINRKAVGMYNMKDNLLKTFDCITDASKETGASQGSISGVCRGTQKSAGGYLWKYIE